MWGRSGQWKKKSSNISTISLTPSLLQRWQGNMIEIKIEGRKNHLVVRNTAASPSPRDLGDTKGCMFREYSGQVYLPHAFILPWATATDDCWRWNTDLNEFLVHALHWVCLVPPCLHCSIMCYIIIIMIKHDSVLHAGLSSLCLFPADRVSVWPINEIQKTGIEDPPPTKPRRQKRQEITLPSPVNEQMKLQ